MKTPKHHKTKKRRPVSRIITRISVCLILLLSGLAAMIALAGMKAPPPETGSGPRPLRVKVKPVQFEDVPVIITGHGEIRPLNVVTIAAEVTGRVTEVHPQLETGERIPQGALLFRIDGRDYRAAVQEAAARTGQIEHEIRRLRQQKTHDRRQMKHLKRNLELANRELERHRQLFKEDRAVSKSRVEAVEQSCNEAQQQVDKMAETIALCPVRIKEAEHRLYAARARLVIAETELARCEIRAPFNCRIKNADVEPGQHLEAGQAVVTLADDSVLEVRVPLDSHEVRKWLCFEAQSPGASGTWFSGLTPVQCKIRWTENLRGRVYTGTLHRVTRFEPETRTVTVAVRLNADQPAAPDAFPLVDGMFCLVEIPGKTLKQVTRLPRAAVGFDGTVFVAENDRLKTVSVKTAHSQGDEMIISGGLNEGDRVIVTRLVNPMENALVAVADDVLEGEDSLASRSDRRK